MGSSRGALIRNLVNDLLRHCASAKCWTRSTKRPGHKVRCEQQEELSLIAQASSHIDLIAPHRSDHKRKIQDGRKLRRYTKR
jgi:hypothetical protein